MKYAGEFESCSTLAATGTPLPGSTALHTVAMLPCTVGLQLRVLQKTLDNLIDLQTPVKQAWDP